MTRRRYETSGIALADDPTPELPLALQGLVEPHALLARLSWESDAEFPWPLRAEDPAETALPWSDDEHGNAQAAVAPRLESEEFDTLELSDIEHEVVERRPPAPEPPPTPPAAFERVLTVTPIAATPIVASRGTAAKGPAAGADEVDSLMSEILESEATAETRRSQGDNWWADVFEDTYVRLLPASEPRRTHREVDFLLGALAPTNGARILDVACGYGRHALELAARGFALVGVDQSRSLLEGAFAESERRSLGVEWFLGDMRHLDYDASFDGVYCWHTSFGYFDDATNFQILSAMARALRPGARLVIEQVNRDYVVRACPRRLWWERDELVLMEDILFDHATSRLRVERSIVDGNKRPWEQHLSIRLYSPHELDAMVRRAGLEMLGISGDIAHPGVYLGPDNRHVIVTARRRAG